MTERFELVSMLPSRLQPALERLMYFNQQQDKVLPGIVDSIDRFGEPEIVADGASLRVALSGPLEVQSLFALETGPEPSLAAVMIYTRVDAHTLVLLHVGIAEDYSASGPQADQLLMLRLLNKLRGIAKRLKGVTTIELMYGRGVTRRLPV